MREPSIKLRFPDVRSAVMAYDTLQELGYRPSMAAECDPPELAVHIENNDVQSALEIGHTFGGHLLEEGEAGPKRFDFEPDLLAIPAHSVTDDFTDRYMSGESDDFLGDEYDAAREGYRDSVR